MDVKNPKKVFPSFKAACLKRETEVRDFVNKHSSVGLNPRKVLQLEGLQEDLRDQFKRMQRDWDNAKADIADDIVFGVSSKRPQWKKTAVEKGYGDKDYSI